MEFPRLFTRTLQKAGPYSYRIYPIKYAIASTSLVSYQKPPTCGPWRGLVEPCVFDCFKDSLGRHPLFFYQSLLEEYVYHILTVLGTRSLGF